MKARSREAQSLQHRVHIGRRVEEVDAVGFCNVLTGTELLETTEPYTPEHRE